MHALDLCPMSPNALNSLSRTVVYRSALTNLQPHCTPGLEGALYQVRGNLSILKQPIILLRETALITSYPPLINGNRTNTTTPNYILTYPLYPQQTYSASFDCY